MNIHCSYNIPLLLDVEEKDGSLTQYVKFERNSVRFKGRRQILVMVLE